MGKRTSQRPSYRKPWLSYQDQVSLLQSRGVIIDDVQKAVEFLQHVNYYRFSGYCLAFESSRHQFSAGVSFQQIQDAYLFDRSLRDLLTEALEIVELDFRAAIAYHFGERYGAFAHTNRNNFFHKFDHKHWLEKLHTEAKRSSEIFVSHFKITYREFPDLPVWVIMEIMSFGALSFMGAGMLKGDQKAIARKYGLQPCDWVSWLHHLTYVRNLCAHHSRLWDRIWSIKPQLPAAKVWKPPHLPGNHRLYVTLLILNYLMVRCPTITSYAAEWRTRVQALFANPPSTTNAFQQMGLTQDWHNHVLWT
ncbi:MAG: Abi family protein [Phycisphaerae bacterium]|nr:Abi family protein [Phycisphaerae bacterium]